MSSEVDELYRQYKQAAKRANAAEQKAIEANRRWVAAKMAEQGALNAERSASRYDAVRRALATEEFVSRVVGCHANRDGDCNWSECPQAVDYKSWCPLASKDDGREW